MGYISQTADVARGQRKRGSRTRRGVASVRWQRHDGRVRVGKHDLAAARRRVAEQHRALRELLQLVLLDQGLA